MEVVVFPHLGQGSGGRPVAGKPHAGKYRELTLLRLRGGRGTLTLSLTLWLYTDLCENNPEIVTSMKNRILKLSGDILIWVFTSLLVFHLAGIE